MKGPAELRRPLSQVGIAKRPGRHGGIRTVLKIANERKPQSPHAAPLAGQDCQPQQTERPAAEAEAKKGCNVWVKVGGDGDFQVKPEL